MPVDDVGRVLVGVLEALRVRDDLLVDELADGLQDRGLHVGQAGRLGEAGHRWTSVDGLLTSYLAVSPLSADRATARTCL